MTVLLAALAVIAVTVSGCSDHDPLAISPAQPTTPGLTVPLGPAGSNDPSASGDAGATPGASVVAADGKPVTAAQVAKVAAALSSASGQEAVLGADFNRRFLGVQIQAIGFNADQTTCVVAAAETSAGAGFAVLTVGKLGALMGQIGPSLTSCLGSGGVPPNLGNPDFSRVPAAEVRAVLGELSGATFVTVGLTPTEATCVSGRQIAAYDDAELGRLFSAATTSRPLSDDVAACLDSARIGTLAAA